MFPGALVAVVFAVVEVVGPALSDYRGLLRGHHLLGGVLLLGLVI